MKMRFLAIAAAGLGLAFAGLVGSSDAAAAKQTTRSVQPTVQVPAGDLQWLFSGKGKDGDSCKKQTDCAPGYACRKSVCRKA